MVFVKNPAAVVHGWPASVIAAALLDQRRRGFFDRLPRDQRADVFAQIDDVVRAAGAWRVPEGQDGSRFALPAVVTDAPPSLLVDREEAARLLGVSESTVKRLLHDGKLPSRRIGGRRLIVRQGLLDFIDGDEAVEGAA